METSLRLNYQNRFIVIQSKLPSIQEKVPLDALTARLAGLMSDAAIAQGCHPGFSDVAIAALARHAGLLLLTCNLKHFQPLDVACVDPLIALPQA